MDEDIVIEAELPVKEKKLKQARLPFQILSASESPKLTKSSKEFSPTINKKRKLTSPSPKENKSSKLIKITSKENETNDVITTDNINAENDEDDKTDDDKKKTKGTSKNNKTESKIKSDTLTRFLVKTDKDVKKLTHEESKQSEEQNEDETEIEVETKSSKVKDKVDEELTKTDLNDCEVENKNDASDERADKTMDNEQNDDKDVSMREDNDDSSSEQDEDESEMSYNEDVNKSTPSGTTPTSNVTKRNLNVDRKRTPRQLQKQMEREKKIEERRKMRLEKEKKREEEREMRRKEKEEKRKEKEEKEKAERELKKKEKEQKQKEKEAMEKKKEEEKRKRKEAKEEEERRKEEEKLEAERKKQKAASNFIGFFVAKKPETKNNEEKQAIKFTNFMPFEVKADMKIAPINRREISDEEKELLDELRKSNAPKSNLYLKEIKNSDYIFGRSGKTYPLEMKDEDDVVIIEEEEDDAGDSVVEKGNIPIEKHRPKLLSFHENRRPPYWGTWRKKSSVIKSRKPLAMDEKCFDYEVDSDEEWEEEEPGESLHGSDDEKDEENNPEENEYDVDNEFMVPHGYLSDEEVREDDEEEDVSPEIQKFKLKVLGEEFEAERKEKTLKLKPKVIGCIWLNKDGNFPEHTSGHAIQLLSSRQAWIFETPISINAAPDVDNRNTSDWVSSSIPNSEEKSMRGAKRKYIPEEAIPDLIRLCHGNVTNRNDLAKEFCEYWNKHKNNEQSISKRSFILKVREIATWMACPDEGPMHQKMCWYVSENIRKKYLGDEKLELPNKWSYVLTKRKPEIVEKDEKPEKDEKKNLPLITQFAKKITQEEMQKQLQELKTTPQSVQQRPPKRATLISVPRGEQLPKSPRVSLLDKFVAAASKSIASGDNAANNSDEDIIIIDDNDDNENTQKKKKMTTTGQSIPNKNKQPRVEEVGSDKSADSTINDKQHVPME